VELSERLRLGSKKGGEEGAWERFVKGIVSALAHPERVFSI